MAGQRQPIDVIVANGRKHMTKAEEDARCHFEAEPGMDFSNVPASLQLNEYRDGERRTVVDTRDWPVWYFKFKERQLTNEIARLIVAMGGKEETVYGLCHLGDYEATLFSEHSHNRTFGRNVVQNKDYDKLAEGYYTVKALRNLGWNCRYVKRYIRYCMKMPNPGRF